MSRPNLTVETHVHALSILFEGERAVGVVGARLSEMVVNRAEREVIVCGGTYNSPQLLMLSGIGAPAELEELQIEVVAESPEMGLNLHDHPNSGRGLGIDEEISLFGALNEENLALFEAEGRGRSPRTSPRRAASSAPATTSRRRTSSSTSRPRASSPRASCRATATASRVGACVLEPKSRGFVVLGSPDPTAKPLIVHNYLEHPDDVASIVAGLRTALEICESGRLGELSTGMLIGPDSHSDEDLEAHCRQRLQDALTTRWELPDGRRADLRRGPRAQGARASRACEWVDASVMPTVPRGNTNGR
jgi:choline dehydrogenase-like flavoprotein